MSKNIAVPMQQFVAPKWHKSLCLGENHRLPLANSWLEKSGYRIAETQTVLVAITNAVTVDSSAWHIAQTTMPVDEAMLRNAA